MNRKHLQTFTLALAFALLTVACNRGGDGRDSASTAPSSNEMASQKLADSAARSSEPARAVAPSQGQAQSAGGAAPPAANSAPGSTGSAVDGSGVAASQLPSIDRKIIYTVTLDLTVKDVQSSYERIALLATQNGGYVSDSSMRLDNQQRRATVTIRVPTDRYQDVLNVIREQAVENDGERSTSNDVSEEYTDLQSRLRNLEATEQTLLGYLAQAKNVTEVFQVQDRINGVRTEIERIKGRLNLLNRLTDLATITTNLKPEGAVARSGNDTPSNPALAALQQGWDASIAVVGGVATALLTALAFSWWLIPFALLAAWAVQRLRRRRAARPVAAPPAAPPAA